MSDLTRDSKIQQSHRKLQGLLAEILDVPSDRIALSQRLSSLIPKEERRRVWAELRQAGVALPALELSGGVFSVAALVVLSPVLLIALVLKTWLAFLSNLELGVLARKVTRPWAIHPPCGCETVYEALLEVTPVTHEDYKSGRWPRQEIAAKVRQVLARALNIPFEKITDQTRLIDICDC